MRYFLAAVVASALASGCTNEANTQAFGTAFPEPARGLSFAPGGRCNVEFVTGVPMDRGWRTDTAKPLKFGGWALEDVAKPASEWIVVELAAPGDRARYFAVTTFRSARADLAYVLGDGPGARNAAFELVARADTLPRGRYVVRVLMLGGTGGLMCETNRVLELT
ncbi:MAG: hypothetical protein ABI569_07890 [Casimicrobiaceae bacterium]